MDPAMRVPFPDLRDQGGNYTVILVSKGDVSVILTM